MRLLSWNILHGGGSRAKDIVAAIAGHAPDIVTLQEFRRSRSRETLEGGLKELGLSEIYLPPTQQARDNTVLVASCHEFEASTFAARGDGPARCVQADFSSAAPGFTLIACHLPQKKAQVPFFNAFLDLPAAYREDRTLICGDLNCGIPFEDSETKTFYASHLFRQMRKVGWIDAWRSRHDDAREFTWISTRNRNGFRYDQALASAPMDAAISAVEYDHGVREQGISDHSLMLIDFEP